MDTLINLCNEVLILLKSILKIVILRYLRKIEFWTAR